MNGCPAPWLNKIAASYQAGHIEQAIALVKSGVIQNKGTRAAIQTATVKGLWEGRLKFEPLRTGRASKSPDFDVAIVYWGSKAESFRSQFEECCAEIW